MIKSTFKIHCIRIISKDVLVVSSLLMKEAPGVLSRRGFNTENWVTMHLEGAEGESGESLMLDQQIGLKYVYVYEHIA